MIIFFCLVFPLPSSGQGAHAAGGRAKKDLRAGAAWCNNARVQCLLNAETSEMTEENTFYRNFYIQLTRLPGPWLLGDLAPTGAVFLVLVVWKSRLGRTSQSSLC